jgi:hypothetical protein
MKDDEDQMHSRTASIRKAAFAWASIAGADPEPVELIDENTFMGRGSPDRKGVLTTGCQDPFWLDDETAGVVLYVNALSRPENLEDQGQRDIREAEYRRRRATAHSWRGPR